MWASDVNGEWGAVAEWVRPLACTGDGTVRCGTGSNPTADNFASELWQFRFPALPVYFGGDTKSRRSILSGVYARGSKRSHQAALECVTVVDSTTHSKLPDLQSAIMRRKTLPCTCIGRRRRRSGKTRVLPLVHEKIFWPICTKRVRRYGSKEE